MSSASATARIRSFGRRGMPALIEQQVRAVWGQATRYAAKVETFTSMRTAMTASLVRVRVRVRASYWCMIASTAILQVGQANLRCRKRQQPCHSALEWLGLGLLHTTIALQARAYPFYSYDGTALRSLLASVYWAGGDRSAGACCGAMRSMRARRQQASLGLRRFGYKTAAFAYSIAHGRQGQRYERVCAEGVSLPHLRGKAVCA